MKPAFVICLYCFSISLFSQGEKPVYPIGENISIGYKTSMVPEIENIIFEFNPNVRLPVFNQIKRDLLRVKEVDRRSKLAYGFTNLASLYVHFRPKFRMYQDSSRPVKTPNFQGGFGYQKMFRLKSSDDEHSFLAFAFETGHYSNGQPNCAFDEDARDESAACAIAYHQINDDTNLSEILNRGSGNFSTNYTEITIKYLFYPKTNNSQRPISGFDVEFGNVFYHNKLLYLFEIGGYSPNDIQIYGKNRAFINLSYFKSTKDSAWLRCCAKIDRWKLRLQNNYIVNPHPSVNPLRVVIKGSLFWKNNLGLTS